MLIFIALKIFIEEHKYFISWASSFRKVRHYFFPLGFELLKNRIQI